MFHKVDVVCGTGRNSGVKKLENCRWKQRWVSHLGCIRGCLDYLGIKMSDGWLYGGTGHAFVINIHDELCPSGPTAWKSVKLFEHGKTLGYTIDGCFGFKDQDDFGEVQKRAYDHVRTSIDQDRPCYGWELEIPEYYVVFGYDDTGYFYSGAGCDEGRGPKPWREFADTGIGILEMYSIGPSEPIDDVEIVRNSLSFALEMSKGPSKWVHDGYRGGIKGFETWIAAFEAGIASDMGTRYNAGVWSECRTMAVEYLKEAKRRIPERADSLFDEAIREYSEVANQLKNVAEIYPWVEGASEQNLIPVNRSSERASEALEAAMDAEAKGLVAVGEILERL